MQLYLKEPVTEPLGEAVQPGDLWRNKEALPGLLRVLMSKKYEEFAKNKWEDKAASQISMLLENTLRADPSLKQELFHAYAHAELSGFAETFAEEFLETSFPAKGGDLTADEVPRLVQDLNSDDFDERETASTKLYAGDFAPAKVREIILRELEKAAKSDERELSSRAGALLRKLKPRDPMSEVKAACRDTLDMDEKIAAEQAAELGAKLKNAGGADAAGPGELQEKNVKKLGPPREPAPAPASEETQAGKPK